MCLTSFSLTRRWAAFALAGVSAGAVIAQSVATTPASCSSDPQNVGKQEDMTEQIQDFKRWLSGLGAHTDAINITQSAQVSSAAPVPYCKHKSYLKHAGNIRESARMPSQSHTALNRRHMQGHGLGLYPSASGVRHHNAARLRPLQRLVGMRGETTLASFPLQTVLSAKLVTQQPGVDSAGCCSLTAALHDKEVIDSCQGKIRIA